MKRKLVSLILHSLTLISKKSNFVTLITFLVAIFFFVIWFYDERKKVSNDIIDDNKAPHRNSEKKSGRFNNGTDKSINIALGVAITSHNEKFLNLDNIEYQMPFLKTLLPSFCRTCSIGFNYHFYVSFDTNDPHFTRKDFLNKINSSFRKIILSICKKGVVAALHLVKCSHSHNPTWAQNDAMIEAYVDEMDFYYRLNDDTEMLSPAWTEAYIEGLQNFVPPNIGVVGPLHKGGNDRILTYDFVHKSHIDIFGFYYPRIFTDWWADNWITSVYGPEKTLKMPNVRLVHTEEKGTRYDVDERKGKFLKQQIQFDQQVLGRYLTALKSPNVILKKLKKVISMSLWTTKARYTYGAIRNAQLLSTYFPGWYLRFYVELEDEVDGTTYPQTSKRIVKKLRKMKNVEIIEIKNQEVRIPPMLWRFLVVDDESVDVFIVRDSDSRLNDRDATIVRSWLSAADPVALHCIRDHPSHASHPLLGGMWGGVGSKLRKLIQVPWKELMMGLRSDYGQDMSFLENVVWPKLETGSALCHDSVSCNKWKHSQPFPIPRNDTIHVGQVFDAFGNANEQDIESMLDHRTIIECNPPYNLTANNKT